MDLGFRGKTVVVTGASRGIGRSIAQHFVTEGARVAICARDDAALQRTASDLRAGGGDIIASALDVRDRHAFGSWIRDVQATWGGVDSFIWNVSAQSSSWAASFNTDIEACVSCIETVVPVLRQSPSPSIVALGSRSAVVGVPTNKAYSAVKAALIHYMASLSQELCADGIRVNCVSPSEVFAHDGIWSRIREADPARYERAVKRSPVGRMATPEEVARVVVFLASTAASFVSGVNVIVDCGAHAHVNF